MNANLKETLKLALVLLDGGISTIPVGKDKIPFGSWKDRMTKLPTREQLTADFSGDAQLAINGGHLQCIDIDSKHDFSIWSRYVKRCEEAGLGLILKKVIRQRTPSGGKHLVFRCPEQMRNLKLAKNEDGEVTLETRGDGGYFLAPPSEGYFIEQGSYSDLPTLTVDERDDLLAIARSFDEAPQRNEVADQPKAYEGMDGGAKPGDQYDAQAEAEFPQLLKSHGWTQRGNSKYWTRPGKERGISASWDVIPGRFWVFSTSTGFDAEHVYKPWHVYSILEHGGDHRSAAVELFRKGYGEGFRKKEPSDYKIEALKQVNEAIKQKEEDNLIEFEAEKEEELDELRRMLAERRYDPDREPPVIEPIFSLAGRAICTPGNLTTITAQVKAGKSAFCSAMISAAMHHPDVDADYLGLSGANYSEKGMIYIDTEQAPDDFWYLVTRARKRAEASTTPGWIHAHCIADLGPELARLAVQILLEDAAKAHGGIHSVIVDGVADLVHDVNDARECNGLVTELHGAAIKYQCAIICVIHLNALTSKNGIAKATGHLGSRLEKKAESNLKLEKESEVTVVWSDKQRKGPIFKNEGPRFAWDDDLKMHASVKEEASNGLSITELALRDVFEEVFDASPNMRYGELRDAIIRARGWAEKTCEKKIAAGKAKNFIKLEMMYYSLIPIAFSSI